MAERMPAWRAPGHDGRIALGEVDRPEPVGDEVLVEVEVCGVCRTDLHVIDGELAPRHSEVTPGHQVIGRVVGRGPSTLRFEEGERVGIAWLRETDLVCRWCRRGRENLCPHARFTGWDADGGYAPYAVVREGYAYRIPDDADAVQLAPMLCAGIIGYRALERAALPDGGSLAILGFGSSAHLTAQLALARGAEVIVLTRSERNQALARELGCTVVPSEQQPPPHPVDSTIVFAPAGETVPLALKATARGGTVVVAGVHLSTIPPLDYDALLFEERDLRSVTANTRADGEAFLAAALRLKLRAHTTTYPFERVDRALDDLRNGRTSGSLVVEVKPG